MKTFKQIILLIAAIAFIATISNAQNTASDTRDQAQFGLKIGGNQIGRASCRERV